MTFKSIEDLNRAIENNKTESIIRKFWTSYKEGLLHTEFTDNIKETYNQLYPDTDAYGNDIDYAEYISELNDETYQYTSNRYDAAGNITEEVQAIIDSGTIRPTVEYYINKYVEEHRTEYIYKTTVTETIYATEYIPFIKPVLLKRIQSVADDFTGKIKDYLADISVTETQVERYKEKYNLALEAQTSGDYTGFELEATLTGTTPEELVTLITEMGSQWATSFSSKSLLIDACRVKAKSIVNSLTTLEEIDKLNNILDSVTDKGLAITEEEIIVLFSVFD